MNCLEKLEIKYKRQFRLGDAEFVWKLINELEKTNGCILPAAMLRMGLTLQDRSEPGE